MLEYLRMSAKFSRLAKVCGPPCCGASNSEKSSNSSARMSAALQPDTRLRRRVSQLTRPRSARARRESGGASRRAEASFDTEPPRRRFASRLSSPHLASPGGRGTIRRAREQHAEAGLGIGVDDHLARDPAGAQSHDAIAEAEELGQIARGDEDAGAL